MWRICIPEFGIFFNVLRQEDVKHRKKGLNSTIQLKAKWNSSEISGLGFVRHSFAWLRDLGSLSVAENTVFVRSILSVLKSLSVTFSSFNHTQNAPVEVGNSDG